MSITIEATLHIVERRAADGSGEWHACCSEFWWTAEDARTDAAERNRAFKGLGWDYRAAEYRRVAT